LTPNSGDHIFGLLPLLASRLNGAGGMVDETSDPRASRVLNSEVSHFSHGGDGDGGPQPSFSLWRYTGHQV
jgi:hypothetical protein